ncbi:MAG: hypothetical protein AAGD34_21760 [Pseudomonadota bacterium]
MGVGPLKTDNLGVIHLNDLPCPDEATLAVTGMGRSGTTMVARIFTALGVAPGMAVGTDVLESPAWNEAARNLDFDAFAALCRTADAGAAKWMVKSPKLRTDMEGFAACMRNARYVVMFRDPVAIAQRNVLVMGEAPAKALTMAARGMARISAQVSATTAPCLLMSYEKALQHPGAAVDALADFAGVRPVEAVRAAAMAMVRNGDPAYFGGVPSKAST